MLRGAMGMLYRFHPTLYVEFGRDTMALFGDTPEGVGEYLRQRGYGFIVDNGGSPLPVDLPTLVRIVPDGDDAYNVLCVHGGAA